MENFATFMVYLVLTYLIGSIPFGFVVGKIFGKDITKEGSGNIGATNVTRTIGKKAGALVLILDLLKGFLPVYIADRYFGLNKELLLIVGLFAVAGHIFSIFMKFKGGKGVATAFGVLLAISYKTAIIVFLVWLGTFLVSGYVSLASITASFLAWIIFIVIEGGTLRTVYYLALISFLIIFKHKSNIQRLLNGNENRFLYKN